MSKYDLGSYRGDLERFGFSYALGDIEHMMAAHSRYDELIDQGKAEEAIVYWRSIREGYFFKLMTPTEFDELSVASRDELDGFRASLDFRQEDPDD